MYLIFAIVALVENFKTKILETKTFMDNKWSCVCTLQGVNHALR